MHRNIYASVAAAVILASAVSAQTSMYIPGFDPQPVTVNTLGVGAGGETTYLIAPGARSGSYDDYGFNAPATLVVGPTQAHLIYDAPTDEPFHLEENCVINGDIAECTVIAGVNGVTSSDVATETVMSFPVQVGGATSISVASQPAVTAPTDSSASAGSSPMSAPVQTGSSASSKSTPLAGASQSSGSGSPAPTNAGANGAGKAGLPILAAGIVSVLGMALLA